MRSEETGSVLRAARPALLCWTQKVPTIWVSSQSFPDVTHQANNDRCLHKYELQVRVINMGVTGGHAAHVYLVSAVSGSSVEGSTLA